MPNPKPKTTRTNPTQKKQGKARTKAEVFALVGSICAELESGTRSIDQACAVLNINKPALYDYLSKYPELRTKIDTSREKYKQASAYRFDSNLRVYNNLLARHESAFELMRIDKPYVSVDLFQTKDYLKLLKDKSDLELKVLAKIDPQHWGDRTSVDMTTNGESLNTDSKVMDYLDDLAKEINKLSE